MLPVPPVQHSRPENQIHNYALSLLAWTVQEQINGGTDWYEVAAFNDQDAAIEYAEFLNKRDTPALPYVVSYVGTRYGSPDKEN